MLYVSAIVSVFYYFGFALSFFSYKLCFAQFFSAICLEFILLALIKVVEKSLGKQNEELNLNLFHCDYSDVISFPVK